MKKLLIIGLSIAALGMSALWAIDFQTVDDQYDKGSYNDALQSLSSMLNQNLSDKDEAEVYWRLSRVQMEITDLLNREGGEKSEVLAGFEKGIEYANDGILADPANYLTYFWRSANTGKWGQSKGILDSLDKAKPMRDDLERSVNLNPRHGESWKVLGMLYSQVPGIISFGDKDAAVSLGRKSVDSRDAADDFDNHYELAKILAARDWSSSKRNRSLAKKKKEFEKETNLLDKHFYYEGVVDFNSAPSYTDTPLKDLSDKEEAVDLLNWVKAQIERLPNKQESDYRLLTDVQTELEDLQ